MIRATIASLLARKLRLVLTALAEGLGVGFTAGTYVLTDTALQSFDQLFGQVYQGTDVVVQARAAFTPSFGGSGGGAGSERNPIRAELLPTVRSVEGVRAADGDVAAFAQIVDPRTGKVIQNGGAPTIGNSWDPHVTSLIVERGGAPVGPHEVAIDEGAASAHDLAAGQAVRVVTP